MKAIVIHSANDASAGCRRAIGGSVEGFVDLMNQRAQAMGLKDTHYVNVTVCRRKKDSLPTSPAPTILRSWPELVKYPEILKWSSTPKDSFRDGKFVLENTNHLIGTFPGADGLKAGSDHEAGLIWRRLRSVTASADFGDSGSPRPRFRVSEGRGFCPWVLTTTSC